MSKVYFYAVASGIRPGIYNTWAEIEPLVKGVKGAKFRKFKTRADAMKFINDPGSVQSISKSKKATFLVKAPPLATHVYTDGSIREGKEGLGICVMPPSTPERRYSHKVLTTKPTNQRAELRAIEWVLCNVEERPLHILTDSMYSYSIITKWMYSWAENDWLMPNRNRPVIMNIYNLMMGPKAKQITFQHVPAHCGIYGNEIADKLANQAID